MRLSPDALDLLNGLAAWIKPLNDGKVEPLWLSHLLMSFDVYKIPRVHALLKSDQQEHVVRLIMRNTGGEWMTPYVQEWEEWLEKHLTGGYNIFVSNATGRDKCVEVSFEEVKDAVLFKMFFG